jgi:glycosyltransferase involved in cell wall biosynthesis
MDQPHMNRRPRLAFLLLPTLDHFAQDLIARLPEAAGCDVRAFPVTSVAALHEAMVWACRPGIDALWFEFCWPPFPQLVAQTDFAGRRVIVRLHRIEAMETSHAAAMPWRKVDDLIVVSSDMAARVKRMAPDINWTTRLHVVSNGLDLDRFAPLTDWNPYRIGWCGLMTMRKNPVLALQVLDGLRRTDPRYHLHVSSSGGDPLATESFFHLAGRLGLLDRIRIDGRLPQADMPAWHARNGVLLHTSLHESFGYAIAEAAAAGCDIALLDHPGAEEFWPAAMRFGTIDEAVRLIRAAGPHRWRQHVANTVSLDRQIAATADMLRIPAVARAS